MHLSATQLRQWLANLKAVRSRTSELFGFFDVEMAFNSAIGDIRDVGRSRSASLPSVPDDSLERALDDMEDFDRWIESGLGGPLVQSKEAVEALSFSPIMANDEDIDFGIRAWLTDLEARLEAGEDAFGVDSVLLDLFDAVATEARQI